MSSWLPKLLIAAVVGLAAVLIQNQLLCQGNMLAWRKCLELEDFICVLSLYPSTSISYMVFVVTLLFADCIYPTGANYKTIKVV